MMDTTQQNTAKISVIVAAYNAESTLGVAIESVLMQTHQCVEIIVVDDCSADNTFSIAKYYAKRDPRVCVHQTLENSGPSAARNLAITHATGDWVAVLDADDWFAPTRLAELLEVALSKRVDMVIDSYFLADKDNHISYATKHSNLCPEGESTSVDAAYFVKNGLGATKPLINAKKIECLRFATHVKSGEDLLFYFQLLLTGASCQFVNKPLYYRTEAPSSLSRANKVRFLSELTSVLALLRRITEQHIAAKHPGCFDNLLEAIDYRQSITEDALVAAKWRGWVLRKRASAQPSLLTFHQLIRHWWNRKQRYAINTL